MKLDEKKAEPNKKIRFCAFLHNSNTNILQIFTSMLCYQHKQIPSYFIKKKKNNKKIANFQFSNESFPCQNNEEATLTSLLFNTNIKYKCLRCVWMESFSSFTYSKKT